MDIFKSKSFQKALVTEVTNLKKHATKAEIRKLAKTKINSTNRFKCIYGTMTGNCNSTRAHELIKLCCSKVLNLVERHRFNSAKMSGKPDISKRQSVFGRLKWITPIERYIISEESTNKENVAKVVDYLKGKTEEFKP